MQLAMWTYEGPPHVGAMRIATDEGLHYVLHAPQGDTYADLLFTMIERNGKRPPVTYTTFQARDLAADTAELFKTAARCAAAFKPQALLVGASCTAELIQDDPGGLAKTLASTSRWCRWNCRPTRRRKTGARPKPSISWCGRLPAGRKPKRLRPACTACNLLGPTALGFRHRDDVVEMTRLLAGLGIEVNVCCAARCNAGRPRPPPDADFNVVLYPEIAQRVARWLNASSASHVQRPCRSGVGATQGLHREVAEIAGVGRLAPCLTSRAFAAALVFALDRFQLSDRQARVHLRRRHPRDRRRPDRCRGTGFQGLSGLAPIRASLPAMSARRPRRLRRRSADHRRSSRGRGRHQEAQPELVLGTQMERHIAKRLRHALRRDLAPGACAGFPGTLLAADGLRRACQL
jgi:light-independent protochlorophyllide reductase subunit B